MLTPSASLDACQPSGAVASRALVLTASAVLNLLSLALPIVILHVYDRVLPNGSAPTLLVLGFGLAAALALEAVLRAARGAVVARVGAGTEHALRSAAMERLLYAPLTAVEREPTGAHLDRFAAVGVLRDRYSGQLGATLMDLPFAALFVAAIGAIGGWLVVAPLTVMGVFAAATWMVSRHLRRSVAARAAGDAGRHAFLLDLLRGFPLVKALALDQPLLRRYERLQETSADAARAVAWHGALIQSLGGLAGQANVVVLLGFGAVMVMDGSLSAGQLAACTLLVGRALQPVQAALGIWTMRQEAEIARAKVRDALALPAEGCGDIVDTIPDSVPEGAPRAAVAVALRDVTLGDDGGGPPLVAGVSLAIAPGEAVAICGGVGSGKTSLLLALLGLARPRSGEVLVDGQRLDGATACRLRRKAALLPQRGTVFEGTLLDNLTGLRDGERASEAMYLSYLLGLDAVVRRWPDGYATRLGGELGRTLPGGIRQQIANVRALVGEPSLVLFDEANLSLDSDNNRRLYALLAGMKGRVTLVMATGDPEFLALADRKLTLAGGRLTTAGVSGDLP